LHWPTVILATAMVVLLFTLHRLVPRLPGPLITVALYYSRGFPVRGRAVAHRDGWSAACGYIELPPFWFAVVTRFR